MGRHTRNRVLALSAALVIQGLKAGADGNGPVHNDAIAYNLGIYCPFYWHCHLQKFRGERHVAML
jgi:hypothetical protein